MTYAEVFSKLSYEVAIITFLKKDGNIRVMLGTRNLNTVALKYGFQGQRLGGHDNRCNINNGNVAVFDMEIGDARSFNIDRLSNIEWLGVISTPAELDNVIAKYIEYKTVYEKSITPDSVFNSINTDVNGGVEND